MTWNNLMSRLSSWRTNLFSGDAGREASFRLQEMHFVIEDLVATKTLKDRNQALTRRNQAEAGLREKLAWSRARSLLNRIKEEQGGV